MIAAFNVKNFGWKKANNKFVRTQLIEVTHCADFV